MNKAVPRSLFAAEGMAEPFRYATFRRIWSASLLSNLGLLIQGVGAAWAMTQLTPAADMVALVQTATMLPILLVSVGAGALADMYDRRRVALAALSISVLGTIALFALAFFGLVTPAILLIFCFLIGSGYALFGPAWQASVGEQVPAGALPSAIALNSISYNIARSFGPAIGGVIVATAGAVAAFGTSVALYLPLLVVLFRWRRIQEPSRLPPERLNRAMASGVRYVLNSPAIRIILTRTFVMGLLGGAIVGLMPLVARNLLGAGAQIYGVMLGAFGMGAVTGALNIARARRFSAEAAVRTCSLVLGVAIAVVALSRSELLTAAVLVIAGAAWMIVVTLFNIGVQLSVPRWVAGRALASFQAAIAGGIALGSWSWGTIADLTSLQTALLIAGSAMLASPLLGRWLRMPQVGPADGAGELLDDPEVRMSLTARSGPIVVEIEYRVEPHRARAFYRVMQAVQRSRQRNGAYGWSIARDLADPELWTERYHCPTWLDFLHQRNRATQSERALQQEALNYHHGGEPVRIRRMLERPFGSVRWREETPDRAVTEVLPMAGHAGGGT